MQTLTHGYVERSETTGSTPKLSSAHAIRSLESLIHFLIKAERAEHTQRWKSAKHGSLHVCFDERTNKPGDVSKRPMCFFEPLFNGLSLWRDAGRSPSKGCGLGNVRAASGWRCAIGTFVVGYTIV